MEAGQAYDGPDTEEADDANNDAGGGASHSVQKVCLKIEKYVYGLLITVMFSLTCGPWSLESSTRWVTAHTKMKTQWKASETRKR